MIDIHTHIIPNVDDGSKSLEASIKMLREEIALGVTDVICTPHFRQGMFETSIEVIKEKYNILLNQVKTERLDVRLYLGQEIYISRIQDLKKLINDNLIITMNETSYLLLEFSYTKNIDISEVVYNAKLLGYKAIIAHIERYQYLSIEDIHSIKEMGALIQVNASAVIGADGLKVKSKVKKLLKEGLVDMIASDIHESRKNNIGNAYNYIVKKFGLEYAKNVFENNSLVLI